MSSWANRHLLRKRDISQIPEPFRPVIVPRVARPEVVQSETYQQYDQDQENQIIYPIFSDSYSTSIMPKTHASKFEQIDKRQYPIKKIDAAPRINAVELTSNGKSYVFVILRNIQHTRDNDLWITSYNRIRQFYKNKIIIIDDNSTINTVDGKLVNTEVIYSEWNGAGEILPYYYFLKYKWADRMIFLHDSMFLNRHFTAEEVDANAIFHWHFNSTDLNDMKKITTLLSLLQNNQELLTYSNKVNAWKGCFGAAMMIDIDVVRYLEEMYGLFSKMAMTVRTRKDRQIFERILGLVLFHEELLDSNHCSNFGDILKYPHAFESENQNVDAAAHVLAVSGYNSAIIKVWRGR